MRRWKDKLMWKIAWMIPPRLAYYVAARVMSYGTVGKYGNQIVSDMSALEGLKRWNDDRVEKTKADEAQTLTALN